MFYILQVICVIYITSIGVQSITDGMYFIYYRLYVFHILQAITGFRDSRL